MGVLATLKKAFKELSESPRYKKVKKFCSEYEPDWERL